MQLANAIHTIDTHTMGEPTRIVVGGTPLIFGNDMMEKKRYVEENLDWMRKSLMHEPRGHRDMFGALITHPASRGYDLGVIFMDSGSYLNMCGHGTIGTVTAAINIGMLPKKESVWVETPAGGVECKIQFSEQDEVTSVTFTNVPSFVMKERLSVQVERFGDIETDIVFGGSIFAMVDASDFDLQLKAGEEKTIMEIGATIQSTVNRNHTFQHPLHPEIRDVALVEFSLASKTPDVDDRNAVFFGSGQLDRSPCGTGTCAKMALLHHQGRLQKGVSFKHESILGSVFQGSIRDTCETGGYQGIIPQITGSAWVTGMHQFIIEKEDPYQQGFLLGDYTEGKMNNGSYDAKFLSVPGKKSDGE